jgi:hypothetical protein
MPVLCLVNILCYQCPQNLVNISASYSSTILNSKVFLHFIIYKETKAYSSVVMYFKYYEYDQKMAAVRGMDEFVLQYLPSPKNVPVLDSTAT